MTLYAEVKLRKGIPVKKLTVGKLKDIVRNLPLGSSFVYDGDLKVFKLLG